MDKRLNKNVSDKKYSYEDFLEIIAKLRAPNGCPWDQKQTHESLRECLLEESQEVIDAIKQQEKESKK